MIGSQFHPEFKSRPNKPHPLFLGLIQAAKARRLERSATEEAVRQAPQGEESGELLATD